MIHLSHVLIISFVAAGIARLIRETPLGKRHIKQEKKPIACDLCMAFWTVIFTSTIFFLSVYPTTNILNFILWQQAPAFAPAMWLIKNLSTPPLPPFEDRPEDEG